MQDAASQTVMLKVKKHTSGFNVTQKEIMRSLVRVINSRMIASCLLVKS
jgi:hypothetical protein